jgi:hypothetical protein
MTSPISKRTPPKRNFDDYILTLSRGKHVGMTDVPQSRFTQVSGGPGQSFATYDLCSSPIDIGFSFSFNNKSYNKFVVCVNGYFVLLDPNVNTFNALDTFTLSSGDNTHMRPTFANEHVLLAPWLGNNLSDAALSQIATVNVISDLLQYLGITSPADKKTYTQNVMNGIEVPIKTVYDPAAYACSMCNTTTKQGRALIVRWNNVSSAGSDASGRLFYEVALYENGTIEFNYAPVQNIFDIPQVNVNEIATIGIFLSTTNFRDFASELQAMPRALNENGGAKYDQTFTDALNGTTYASNLRSLSVYTQNTNVAPVGFFNWPTQDAFGATFTFKPPMLRKKVLPRKDIATIDAQVDITTSYDDRMSLTFGSTTVVNYPTTLQRNFNSHAETNVCEQNLFSTNFLVSSSISRNASEQFVTSKVETMISPFVDKQIFHESGSSIDLFGCSLKQPIENKTRIDISLPVNYNTQMLPLTSSMYYYNNITKCWNIPQNAMADLAGPGSYDIFQQTSYYVPEDFRGFGPISNSISSGSSISVKIDPWWSYYELQTDALIAERYSQENFTKAIGKKYQKTVQINSDYEAFDETIDIKIEKPFVLERAIITVPCAMGDSWFKQRTTTFTPADEVNNGGNQSCATFIDFVGPALTCALFNQIKLNNTTRRELICTGSIIPTGDNISTLVFSGDPGLTSQPPNTQFNVRPEGFLAYSSNPAAIVVPNNFSAYTGSISVNCEAAVTNGTILNVSWVLTDATMGTQNRNIVSSILSSSTLPSNDQTRIYSISPLGRSATDLEQSGRSIFGKEYGTVDTQLTNIKNPFYAPVLDAQQQQVVNNGKAFLLSANIPLTKTVQSPYLLFPGDKLVFSVSKTRPKFYGNLWLYASGSAVSGSAFVTSDIANHFDDVQLTSGTIEITLYGSYVKSNKEFHEIKNYSSPIISDVICNDHVTDQFEIMNRDEYVGTITDRYLTGSIIRRAKTFDKSTQFVFGNRALETSIYNSENQPNSDTTSKSFNLQPLFERTPKNVSRMFVVSDYNERYYDTLLPDFSKCLKLDNNVIYTTAAGFNYATFDIFNTVPIVTNLRWTKSFPYENHYSEARRLQSISSGFSTTTFFTSGTTFITIPEKNIPGFFIREGVPTGVFPFSSSVLIASDYVGNDTLNNTYMSNNDYAKVLYGFGDVNTCFTSDGLTYGTNHFSDFRFNFVGVFFVSPVIRGSKYGVHNVLPEYTKQYCSRTHYGFIRDVYEQRVYGRLYNEQNSVTSQGCITVKFIDNNGKLTQPELTNSQNLSFDYTSSIPYIDEMTTDR